MGDGAREETLERLAFGDFSPVVDQWLASPFEVFMRLSWTLRGLAIELPPKGVKRLVVDEIGHDPW
jgi:hypothetical protein